MAAEEFETNNASIRRETEGLDLILNLHKPNRRQLIRHIRVIAEGVEASHERAAQELEAAGNAASNLGNWMILVGIVAPFTWLPAFGRYILLALGSVFIVIGQLGKTRKVGKTNSQKRKVAESWSQVKMLVERDRNAWCHANDKIRHLVHMVQRNQQLLVEDRKIEKLFSESMEKEFATVKNGSDQVINKAGGLWLAHYAPQRPVESLDAVLTTFVADVLVGRRSNSSPAHGEAGEAREEPKLTLEKLNVPVKILTLVSEIVDRECERMGTVLPRENARRLRRLADELDVLFDP